ERRRLEFSCDLAVTGTRRHRSDLNRSFVYLSQRVKLALVIRDVSLARTQNPMRQRDLRQWVMDDGQREPVAHARSTAAEDCAQFAYSGLKKRSVGTGAEFRP